MGKMIWFWISTAWTWPISRSYYFLNTTRPRATSLRFKTVSWALATRRTASILGGHTTSVPTTKITRPSSNKSAIWSMNWLETIRGRLYKKARTANSQPLVSPRSRDLWFPSTQVGIIINKVIKLKIKARINRNLCLIPPRHYRPTSFTCFIMKAMTLKFNTIKLP